MNYERAKRQQVFTVPKMAPGASNHVESYQNVKGPFP
jgi:hypothetical protein